MQERVKLLLIDKANEVADIFSNPNREFNYSKETFRVEKIHPLSENTACVIFIKSSGKKALAFFYWLESRGGYWEFFFIKDSHLLGFGKVGELLQKVEEHNFLVDPASFSPKTDFVENGPPSISARPVARSRAAISGESTIAEVM